MFKYALAIMALGVCSLAQAETQNFDEVKVGQLPDGWVAGVTGDGSPKWAVIEDSTATSKSHVLKQSGEGTFPCVIERIPVSS